MTTTESNKLIAEFMGMKYGDERKFENGEWIHSIRSLSKFQYSWDWLMPVVKKIDSYACEIMTIDEFDNYRTSWAMIDKPSKYPIEKVFEQVVQFIQWYNQNQQSEWTENKLFRVEGYYIDDGMPIDWLIYAYDDCPEELDEDTIDYFGLSESQIKAAIESKEPIDGQYVFTSYEVEQLEE